MFQKRKQQDGRWEGFIKAHRTRPKISRFRMFALSSVVTRG